MNNNGIFMSNDGLTLLLLLFACPPFRPVSAPSHGSVERPPGDSATPASRPFHREGRGAWCWHPRPGMIRWLVYLLRLLRSRNCSKIIIVAYRNVVLNDYSI